MTTDGACVFIDAENISPDYYHRIIDKINEFTYIKSIKAFTDWNHATPIIKRWIDLSNKNACIEKVSYPHIKLKNTSDILLTIHAIELLNTPTNKFDVFVLCSADSDFSPLVTHMKHNGKMTIGFGGENYSKPYKKRFDFYFDVSSESDMNTSHSKAIRSLKGESLNNPKYLGAINLIREAVMAHEKPENKFVHLSNVGLFLKSNYHLCISDLGYSGSLSDFISLYPNMLNITSDSKACSLIR